MGGGGSAQGHVVNGVVSIELVHPAGGKGADDPIGSDWRRLHIQAYHRLI